MHTLILKSTSIKKIFVDVYIYIIIENNDQSCHVLVQNKNIMDLEKVRYVFFILNTNPEL